jgi:hypothetical protein
LPDVGSHGIRRQRESSDLMRHWLERLLPVVAIALLVQVLAPVGAFRAVAQAAVDPLAFATVCTGQHDAGAQDLPAGDADHNCCGFCAAAHGGSAALDPPTIAFSVLPRRYQRVVWPHRRQFVAPQRIGSNSQARAPPLVA